MIRLGIRDVLLKRFSPESLEVPKHEQEEYDYSIERRQRYFHILWIPFFPVGKYWAVRRDQDGALLEAPFHVESHLISLDIRMKPPWYTFLGPILLLLAIAGFGGYTIKEQKDRHATMILSYQASQEKKAEHIHSIQEGDFLSLYSQNHSSAVYFEALANKGDSLQLIGPKAKSYGGGTEYERLKNGFSYSGSDSSRSFTLNFTELEKLFDFGYQERKSFKGIPLGDLDDRYKYIEIIRKP